jgi:3-hydroxybutyryl-CoA dehydrogenase
VKRAGVVGAGTMGVGIAALLAGRGYEVELVDADPAAAERGVAAVRTVLAGAVERGKLAPDAGSAAERRLTAVARPADLGAGADLIVEAVPERMELKRTILAAVERTRPVLLATNTSALSIDRLAAGLALPDRFLGLHFFNPVHAMPLVEVVVGSATAPATLERARRHVAAWGKEAVVVNDAPGFASSRLGIALGLEAIRMVQDGVGAPEDIDRAMQLGYGHPVGPLRLTDVVGLDVRLDIARSLARELGPRFDPPALLEEMVRDRRLGRKAGRGFYRWPR